ncbi:unnamed protein product [Cylicocyclus nassatus]|uniref:60S ribosomal protein L41 n=1 Tax=Cylicocyclus nassatus TaxID=53992 RepID=A0AA36GGF4_CYLNA|nr:unnamed protein product [Cylicocyclus nassatus]
MDNNDTQSESMLNPPNEACDVQTGTFDIGDSGAMPCDPNCPQFFISPVRYFAVSFLRGTSNEIMREKWRKKRMRRLKRKRRAQKK